MTQSIHVLTGCTSGLGLQVARELAADPESLLIVGVRDAVTADRLRSAIAPKQLTTLPLNLSLLSSTAAFVTALNEHLNGSPVSSLICNAGLQIIGPKVITDEGLELTFVTNYLSHFLLMEAMQSCLAANASVVTVGSGTHNAEDPLAKRFGFRGASFPGDLGLLARGDLGTAGSNDQLALDRYATSKLCAILITQHMSLVLSGNGVRYYCFDPGLMPGTGLARDRSFLERLAWTYLLPSTRAIVPGVSSAARSGKALVRHCIVEHTQPSGSYLDYRGKMAPRSALADSTDAASALLQASRKMIERALL